MSRHFSTHNCEKTVMIIELLLKILVHQTMSRAQYSSIHKYEYICIFPDRKTLIVSFPAKKNASCVSHLDRQDMAFTDTQCLTFRPADSDTDHYLAVETHRKKLNN